MSVQVLCPAWGDVAEWHRPPVTECGRCHGAFSAALRGATERALARERAPKPLLLTLGQWGSLLFGAFVLLILLLAPFDIGTYSIGDEVVSGPVFLRRAGWALVLVGGLLAAIGIGPRDERPWVRPLMVAFWFVQGALTLGDRSSEPMDLLGAVLASGIGVGISAWYVYGKRNVRAYFEARAAQEPPPVGP